MYKNLLLSAREAADQRFAEKGFNKSSFQSFAVDEGKLVSKVSTGLVDKRKTPEAKEEDDFLTRYYNRVYKQNQDLKEQSSSRAMTDESGKPVDILNQGDDLAAPADSSTEDFIASFENVGDKKTFKAYWDVNQWAIGFGSKASGENETITLEEARNRLSKDTERFQKIVTSTAKRYGYDWDSNQIKALTSFTYNLGAGNLEKLLEGGTRGNEEISEMILEYNKADGKVLPGLVKRREAESALFSSVN